MGRPKKNKLVEEGVVIPYARSWLETPSGKFEFFYPKELKWECKKCGSCCCDAQHRPRRILLLSTDIERLEKNGMKDFTTKVKGEEPFIAQMKKSKGACINLTPTGCRVYLQRALLCRMYPFWVEREKRSFEIMVDTRCPGIGQGSDLNEGFFRELLSDAIAQRGEI